MTKSNSERKGLFGLQVTVHHGGKPRQELKAGIWRQELKPRLWKNTSHWLAPWPSTFVNQPSPTCPATAPPTVGWAFPHQLAIKKMPHKVLERWLSGYQHLLPFQRTQVQFPTPRSGCSQPPITPDPDTSGLCGQLHSLAPTHTDIHT